MGVFERSKQSRSKKYVDSKDNGNGKKTQPLNILDGLGDGKFPVLPRQKTHEELLMEKFADALLPQMLINLPKSIDDDYLIDGTPVEEWNQILSGVYIDADLRTKEGQLEILALLHPKYDHPKDDQIKKTKNEKRV